jgi:hypothetical protein
MFSLSRRDCKVATSRRCRLAPIKEVAPDVQYSPRQSNSLLRASYHKRHERGLQFHMSGEKESTQAGIAAAPAMWQDGKKSRREVRLGVVMYGGVSLAVYINGVAHEFFRAVRGRGVYRLIKALTDSDIIVDVISGTSAGGINGVMLSYALATTATSRAQQRSGARMRQGAIIV